MLYIRDHDQDHEVTAGQWAGEPALWTPWIFRGALKAITDVSLVCLSTDEFISIASAWKTLEFFPGKYAQEFVKHLNSVDEASLTDLADKQMDVNALHQRVFGAERSRSRSVGGLRRSSSSHNILKSLPGWMTRRKSSVSSEAAPEVHVSDMPAFRLKSDIFQVVPLESVSSAADSRCRGSLPTHSSSEPMHLSSEPEEEAKRARGSETTEGAAGGCPDEEPRRSTKNGVADFFSLLRSQTSRVSRASRLSAASATRTSGGRRGLGLSTTSSVRSRSDSLEAAAAAPPPPVATLAPGELPRQEPQRLKG